MQQGTPNKSKKGFCPYNDEAAKIVKEIWVKTKQNFYRRKIINISLEVHYFSPDTSALYCS